ncbi:MAG TPA: NIPSNAP family protein [Pyrinomonadaceae bacterium]|jgi:hypothetical protein|nr:NIPSNAP family protein [Pyrinomonadaceae bacterium]
MLAKKHLPLLVLVTFAAGLVVGKLTKFESAAAASTQSQSKVFELRTYTTEEGKLDALHARFREHTTKLFEKHGMTNIGYWQPEDAPLSGNTLIYVISHPSREAAKKNWAAFGADPEWQKVKRESEAQGKIVSKVDSVFLDATDYSPLK